MDRNVAVDGASTDFVFCVDVDFVPSANLYNAITDVDSFSSMQEFALESRAVFVVPAFEIKPNCPYPRNVQELRRELASGEGSTYEFSFVLPDILLCDRRCLCVSRSVIPCWSLSD